MQHDVFAMKRTIMYLRRLGVDHEAIRTVVYENPRWIPGLDVD